MPATTPFGLTYSVEMALSAATGSYGAWDAGLWDTATWGPDIIWVDITQWARWLSTQRQFSRDFQGWDSGNAVVELDNRDGRFSPLNLAGPYVTAGVTQIRPWRPVRIRFGYAGTTYDTFGGYGIDWQEGWSQSFPSGGGATMTVRCVDEFEALARFDGLELPAAGGGETSGRRIHRILDAAGHTGARNVAVGRMTMQATTGAGNAVSDLKLTADSEGGAVYVTRDGTVTFEDVYALIEQTRSNTVQATFGDGPGELPYAEVAAEYNGDLLTNIAAFTRVDGAVQTSADETSRALYRDKRSSRTDLICEADPQVKTLADLWVQRFKDPEYRFVSVTLRPRTDPDRLFPQTLGREVRDLVRVKKQPPGGFTISQDLFVSGISHTFTGDDMVTVFDLSSGRPYVVFSSARWDAGLWDTAQWFY